jgi:hypothetical protein
MMNGDDTPSNEADRVKVNRFPVHKTFMTTSAKNEV